MLCVRVCPFRRFLRQEVMKIDALPLTPTFRFSSPIGDLMLAERSGRLIRCDFSHSLRRSANDKMYGRLGIRFEERPLSEAPEVVRRAACGLDDYFAGNLHAFDVPLEVIGTPFEAAVRRVLLTIPFGSLMTYGEVAVKIGRPGAARAVGRAVGANPCAVFVPCHRVVGAGGALTGFAGGLDAKRALLRLEGHDV